MTKEEFLSGMPFQDKRGWQTFRFVGSGSSSLSIGHLEIIDRNGNREYHCNVDKIHGDKIFIYSLLIGEPVKATIQLSALTTHIL